MNDHQPIEKFLETASAGLAGDRELQLDVQAELRSHLDERLRDAEEAGLSGAAAEAKALATMGEPLELADKLATANRPRMRLRAWLRHTLRWALVPLAVLVAVASAWQPVQNSIWTARLTLPQMLLCFEQYGYYLRLFGGNGDWRENPQFEVPATATPEQRLVIENLECRLCRDNNKEMNAIAKAKALWEKRPDNKAYLHNYLLTLFAVRNYLGIKEGEYPFDGRTNVISVSEAEKLITKFKAYDPDNARFDYWLAWIKAIQACRIKTIPLTPSTGNPSCENVLVVKDRVRLDQAMECLRTALGKPVLHSHSGDFAQEYMKIVGRPMSIASSLQQSAVIYEYLPDAVILDYLCEMASGYGELLAREGRQEEADFFLNAWKRMTVHLNADTQGYTEAYATMVVTSQGRDSIVSYKRLGDLIKAAQMQKELDVLMAPWKARVDDRDRNRQQRKYSALIDPRCGMEMLGWTNYLVKLDIPEEQRRWSRQQEYLLADSLMIGLISCLALAALLGCLIVGLWFRFWRKSAPLLLLPSLSEIAWVAVGGGVLPVLIYQALVRLLPNSGHEYSIICAWPKYLASQVFLLVAIGWLTSALSSYFLRRRCRQLGVATPLKAHWGWAAAAGTLLVAQLVFFCIPDPGVLTGKGPSLWPLLPAVALLLLAIFKILCSIPPPRCWHWGWLVPFLGITGTFLYFAYFSPPPYENWTRDWQFVKLTMVLMGLFVFVWLFLAIRHWRKKPESLPFYRGTLVRSLVPVLALSMLFLNLASAPWHRFEERRLVEQKTAIMISPENGWPAFVNQAARQMKAEMQAALEKLGM